MRCSASYQTDRERELARNVPAAPPARVPPPPPPPPPPEPEPIVENELNMSRRGLFLTVFGGTAAYWFALNGGSPVSTVDPRKNVALLKTKGGNTIAATQDAQGRVFMWDRAGNIYYDTEDPRTGVYIVDTAGDMTNMFVDKDGEVQRVPVGNIADLRTIEVSEIGGVPISELQKSIKGLRGGRVTGFVTQPSSVSDLMPPNAPVEISRDGKVVKFPPFLEDIEIELEPKGGLFGGGQVPNVSDNPAAVIDSLQRGNKHWAEGMASYDLTFLLDRVERARRLLSQDSHRGDADLQHFVADMEAVTALLELFLNDEGTAPQQGLTERQKYQGLFHKMQLHNNIFVMPLPLARAIYQLCSSWGGGRNGLLLLKQQWRQAAAKELMQSSLKHSVFLLCAMCRSASQLKKCSKCRAVAYCSRECQVRHWREGGHKAECSRLAAERRNDCVIFQCLTRVTLSSC
ncbi:expressed protein isoform A [Chlorella sorokiniana]|uniref:phytol kinase n=1 Tax=Chlorella sorokiniana TaxID=3076 RepID=A0A2P6TRG6_CHLSO|nr:expressed protein isoform A [Chlorella sorokiniana]|eukprot:PRW56651.1 expressed protein isoform A [Chlorella sorokiniana]